MTDYSELSIKNTADVCRCCSSFSCSHTASSPFDLVALIHPTFLVSLIPLSDCFSISRPLCSAAFPSFPLVLSHQSCLFPCFLPSRVPHSASFLSSLVLFTSYFHQDFYTVKIKRVYFNLFLIWKLVSPVKSGEAFWRFVVCAFEHQQPPSGPAFLLSSVLASFPPSCFSISFLLLSLSRTADNTSGHSASGSLTAPLSLLSFPFLTPEPFLITVCETSRGIYYKSLPGLRKKSVQM